MFNLSGFLSYVLVSNFTPGPNNLMALATSGKYGYKKSIKFAFGVAVGFFGVLLAALIFNIVLTSLIPRVEIVMGCFGAIYMIWLAIKIMKSSKNESEVSNNEIDSKGMNFFITGMFMQFVNPKGIIFALTVLGSFIVPYNSSYIMLVIYCLLLSTSAFLAVSTWSIFGAIFNQYIKRYQSYFNISMGLLLIFSAISGFKSLVIH